MQTSRFQLGLIATLAIGLGFSLSSSDAVGYPSGAAVSLGTNPVWSTGGTPIDGSVVVATATDGDLIITDLDITGNTSSWFHATFALTDGTVVADYSMTDAHNFGGLQRGYESGIRVPQGDSLTLDFNSYYSESGFRYTLTGYTAQP